MICKHETKIKFGTQRYRAGVFQKYQCQQCGGILKGEFLKANEILESAGLERAGAGINE